MKRACGILLFVACLSLPSLSTLSQKLLDFRKRVVGCKISVLIVFAHLSETVLILRRTERDGPKMYIGFGVKGPCYFPILIKLEFSRQIFEKILKFQVS
jgi:hypothetical protein